MSISFERINLEDRKSMEIWDNLIGEKTSSDFRIYCNSNWIKLLNKSYNYESFLYFIKDKNEIIGLIPLMKVKSLIFGNRLISLPITDHSCGPLLFDKNKAYEDIYKFLILVSIDEKIDYVRLHNPPQNSWSTIESFSGVVPYSYSTFRLNLNIDEKSFLNNLEKRTRNDIKRCEAKNQHIDIFITDNMPNNLINSVYRIHKKHMKFLGSPTHNKKFFLELSKQKNIFIFTKFEDEIISFHVFAEYGKEIRWVVGNFHPKYKDNLINTFILWNFIKNNLNTDKILDLGGSRNDSGNYFYKIGWLGKNFANGSLSDLRHYHIFFKRKNVVNPRNNLYEKISIVWKNYLPTFFTDFVGPKIRSGMGI